MYLGDTLQQVHTLDFVVVDVETANHAVSSICQIGIASFHQGRLHQTWESLVNPEVYFDPFNVSISGIDAATVKFSPTWREVYPKVALLLQDQIVVSHMPFDSAALRRACEKSNLQLCPCRWLDSARVVRRTWPTFSHAGYGLSNVAAEFGIEYRAHDALEDARCAGEILLRAIAETKISVEQWLVRAQVPLHPPQLLKPNPDGLLNGEILVFTGTLSISRYEAAEIASFAGCQVADGVNKHTTLLIVGDQDIEKLAGHDKSSKHRKAEILIQKGQQLRIIGESDFKRIVSENQTPMAVG